MSGRKNSLNSYKIVTAGDMSQATVTSSLVNIQNLDNIGIQVNILTGTASGTFAVQVSGDHQQLNGSVSVAGSWITLTSQTVTSGSPSNTYFDLNQLSALWIRLLYTKTSGTGTFEAIVVGKMI